MIFFYWKIVWSKTNHFKIYWGKSDGLNYVETPPPSASTSEAHMYNVLPTKLKCKNRHAMIINCQFLYKIYWIKITADTPSTKKLLDETKIRLAAAICNINRKRQFFQWCWNLLRLRNSDVSPCKSRYQYCQSFDRSQISHAYSTNETPIFIKGGPLHFEKFL